MRDVVDGIADVPAASLVGTVSVVIPTFRREREVVEAVRSALAQGALVGEVLVLDDSPEGSAAGALAALAEPRVRYVRRAVPTGGNPAVVRNEGLALARGKFVHFLDDDDLLEDGALAATVGALEANPAAGVAVGVIVPFGDDPQALQHEREYFAAGLERLRATRSRMELVTMMLFDRTPFVNSSCTVRRECAEAIGGYSPDVRIVEDVDFYLRAIRRCGFVFVDRPVVRYRTGTPSIMHSLRDLSVLRQQYKQIYHQYRRDRGRVEFTLLRTYGTLRRLLRRIGRRAPESATLVHAGVMLWALAG
jgi:glycosyltransferase involved in cell wall biosynthesis